jgi:hypothetical protein
MSVQTFGATDVDGYAAAVRRALVGLGPEQVEDLTDGLEANLADALADETNVGHGPDLVATFGTPQEYADELRAAAGLGAAAPHERGTRAGRALRHPVRAVRALGLRMLVRMRGWRWWPPVEDFLVALRPLWWVARGWVVFQVLWSMGGHDLAVLPGSGTGWLLLLALVVPSVQWGRGHWLVTGRWAVLPRAIGVVAAVILLPFVVATAGPHYRYEYVEVDSGAATAAEQPSDGVYVDGMQVSNLYVYDADGNQVPNAQVYDDRGRPVRTTTDQGTQEWWLYGVDEPWFFAPAASVEGRVLWNVYPLHGVRASQAEIDDDTGLPVAGTAPLSTPPWPFAKAPALVLGAPDDEATTGDNAAAGDDASPQPSEAATPSPSDAASPQPSDAASAVPSGAPSAAPAATAPAS